MTRRLGAVLRRLFTTRSCACLLLVAAAAPLLPATPAAGQMGGLYLPENGGPSNGTAQAGSGAVARDAQTAWLNPAGMTRLDDVEILFSVMPFYLGVQFDPAPGTTTGGSDGGQQGGLLPDGAFFLAAPLNEHVALGFSITAPGGFAIDPADDWVGRSWTIESKLLALNFEPSVGVRLTEHWSLGAGLDVQYLAFRQKLIGPLLGNRVQIDGNSWDVGFSASVLWEPLETTRFGLRYRTEINHSLSGDLTVIAERPISTSFTMPMSLTFSAYHDFTEQFALMADVGWTNWGAFDYNQITFDGSGNSAELPRNWKDTWNISLGAHIRPAERWLVMLGGGYVSSSVSDANRTPDLPLDQQVRVSFGLEYEINDQWTVGGNYTFGWLGNNDVDRTMPIAGRIVGDYDEYIHVFGFYASVKF